MRTKHTLVGVTRRRQCQDCGKRFTTKEEIKRQSIQVMKAGNRPAEQFDEDKVTEVILGVTKGFSVSVREAQVLAQDVRTSLLEKGKTIVSSQEVRSTLLGRLEEFNSVAHERFAALGSGSAENRKEERQYSLFSSHDASRGRRES